MAQTFQAKLLAELERRVGGLLGPEYDVVVNHDFANDGKVLVQHGFDTLLTLYFHFQNGSNSLSFNGPYFVCAQADRFFLKEEDGPRIHAFLDRFDQLLKEAV